MPKPKPNRRSSPRSPKRAPKRFTIQQFAEIVGASVESVELWRTQGMPVEVEKPTGRRGRPRLLIDLPTATDWLVAHKRGGFKHPKGNGSDTLSTSPDTISDEPGLGGAVERARAAERYGFRLLRQAIHLHNKPGVA